MIGEYILFRMKGKLQGRSTFSILVAVPKTGAISLHGEAIRIAQEWQQQTHPSVGNRTQWEAYPRPVMGDPRETIYGRVDV